MIYDYKCSFGHQFSQVQTIGEYTGNPLPCLFCEGTATRLFLPPRGYVVKDFQADYYHSLGKVIHNRNELQYNLDKNNLVAVGNDFSSGDSMQKHFEADRAYRDKKRWDDFDI